jgi:hypothetical protein
MNCSPKALANEDRANEPSVAPRDLEARHRQPHADATPAASSPHRLASSLPTRSSSPTAPPIRPTSQALTDYKVAGVARGGTRAVGANAQRQDQARHEESTRVIQAFEGRAAEARAKHADFDAVALLAPTEIPQGSAADLWVLEDEAGAEILYHLQQPANAGNGVAFSASARASSSKSWCAWAIG